MSTHAEQHDYPRDYPRENPTEIDVVRRRFRVSWSAIFAGLIIAVVVQFLLSLVGLAVGFQALNFQTGNIGGVGVGAGIWALVMSIIALFLGGLVAGRFAGLVRKGNGVLHGILVWGLAMALAVFTLSSGFGTVFGSIFGVAGQTLSAAVEGVTQAGTSAFTQGNALAVATADGQEQIVRVLEQRGMTPQQAQQTAQQIQETSRNVQLQAEQVRARAPQVANQVANALSSAAWWALLVSVASLAAAAIGAALTSKEQ